MVRNALAPYYCQNKELFLRLCEFNLYPVRYMHPDRFDELFGDLAPWVQKLSIRNRRAQRYWSRLVIEKLDLDGNDFFVCQEPIEQGLLLSGEELKKWLFLVGLATYSGAISTEIRKDRVLILKSCLGEPAYRFAVKKAPFLAAPSVRENSLPHDLETLPDLCLEAGCRFLKRALERISHTTVTKMRLKWPSGLSRIWEQTPSWQGSVEDAQRLSLKILKQELRPAWLTL